MREGARTARSRRHGHKVGQRPRRRGPMTKDEAALETEREAQVESLGDARTDWMGDERNERMFEAIEAKVQGLISGQMGDRSGRRVLDQVFDHMTLLVLYKLLNSGRLASIDWPVARGKEAHVFRGEGPDGPVAVKIFHTSNAVFRNLARYIEGDPRFGGLKRRHRDLIEIWVRKEYRNLKRLRNAGLPVPRPQAHLRNVLVMDWIGEEEAAPRLRTIEVDDAGRVLDVLVGFVSVAWHRAKLVHADLSDFNILWHRGEPCVIDVGQAVTQQHPNAEAFLVRDVERLADWAQRQGLGVEMPELLAEVLDGLLPAWDGRGPDEEA